MLQFINSAPAELREKISADIRETVDTGATSGQTNAFNELQEVWQNMVSLFRVLCLSEKNDVTSMWLHYADSYQGVVLEFEANDELDSPLLVARPVSYQDTLPAIANVDEWVLCMTGELERSYEKLFTEFQYVKTTDWEYEREWRIVSMARIGEHGLYSDYPFHARELVGIYFGPKCDKRDMDDLKAMLDHGLDHVRIWEAESDYSAARYAFREVNA